MLTRTGMVLGTPRYMAPEQIKGEPVDLRCDLFAAGATLFEMLAGRPAFGGRTIFEVLHATLHEQPPALGGSPAVAAIDRVIRRALSKRPEDRPASAAAMADELEGRLAIERRRRARPGAPAHASRRPAVPGASLRSRNGLPGIQPSRRDRHIVVRKSLSDGSIECRRRALRAARHLTSRR